MLYAQKLPSGTSTSLYSISQGHYTLSLPSKEDRKDLRYQQVHGVPLGVIDARPCRSQSRETTMLRPYPAHGNGCSRRVSCVLWTSRLSSCHGGKRKTRHIGFLKSLSIAIKCIQTSSAHWTQPRRRCRPRSTLFETPAWSVKRWLAADLRCLGKIDTLDCAQRWVHWCRIMDKTLASNA